MFKYGVDYLMSKLSCLILKLLLKHTKIDTTQ